MIHRRKTQTLNTLKNYIKPQTTTRKHKDI